MAVCTLCLAGCNGGDEEAAPPAPPPAWNHNPADTSLGPTAWGSLDASSEECATGDEQSPIALPAPASVVQAELELTYAPAPLVVENTGHTIEVTIPDTDEHTLDTGDEEYELRQYHFHAPSEHTLDGRRFAAEAHLVHESGDGDIAVVGLLLLETDEGPIPLIDQVLENAPASAGQEVEVATELNPLDLLQVLNPSRALLRGYYGYDGSLTTPGCAEGVRWFVLHGATPISPAAVARLHELIAGFPDYDGYENNNRPMQPRNERPIDGGVD